MTDDDKQQEARECDSLNFPPAPPEAQAQFSAFAELIAATGEVGECYTEADTPYGRMGVTVYKAGGAAPIVKQMLVAKQRARSAKVELDQAEARHADQLASKDAAIAELAGILSEWQDVAGLQKGEEPCWFDHHGYCQAHFLEHDCIVARTATLIAKHKPKEQADG